MNNCWDPTGRLRSARRGKGAVRNLQRKRGSDGRLLLGAPGSGSARTDLQGSWWKAFEEMIYRMATAKPNSFLSKLQEEHPPFGMLMATSSQAHSISSFISSGIQQERESAYLGIGFVRLRSLQKRRPRKWEIDELKAIQTETYSYNATFLCPQISLLKSEKQFVEYDKHSDGSVSWDEYNIQMYDCVIDFDENTALDDAEEESFRQNLAGHLNSMSHH
ncbi:hypothetical protein MC885_004616 [Smutsia gigantea]|nr:hypothetical protein MC885_004616 [Smutsia gigantea]